MAVSIQDLIDFALDEFLDAWAQDGEVIDLSQRLWGVNERAAPRRMDRLTAGPQKAFIRTMKAILNSRRRLAADLMLTPAEDATYKPADRAMFNGLPVRRFKKSIVKRERLRGQDHIMLQKTDGSFVNKLAFSWTSESENEGLVGWIVKAKVIKSDGIIPANYSTLTLTPPTYSGDGKLYTSAADLVHNDFGVVSQGDLILWELIRAADDGDLDTVVDADVGANEVTVI